MLQKKNNQFKQILQKTANHKYCKTIQLYKENELAKLAKSRKGNPFEYIRGSTNSC